MTIRKRTAKSGTASITRRRFAALALGAVAAPALVGRARAAGVIKIGDIQSLTGPSASYGIRARDGAILAVEAANAAGGFKDAKGESWTFEKIDADMANEAKQALTLYRQFATDPAVIGVVGPTNSVGWIATVPVARSMKLPILCNGSMAPVKEWNPYAYRTNPIAAFATPIMLKKVLELEHGHRVAVIYDQAQDAQAADAEICRRQQKELGYELVADEAFRSNDQDFSAQISKNKAANPDIIHVAAATGDGVKVVTQLRGSGLTAPLTTGTGSFYDPVYWDGTNGVIKDSYTWLSTDLASPAPAVQKFLEDYKRFPQAATYISVLGYDTVATLIEALRRAGTVDRDKVQAVLSSLEYTAPLGTKVSFKNPPGGDNLTPTLVVIKITGRAAYVKV
jgi:branched-chain amino acid transport system substrate-binding protein